jgi:hypothetical protein
MATEKKDDVVQATGNFFTNTTMYNQLCYMVRQIIGEMVNTSALVSVGGVEGGGTSNPAGHVSATPLVAQTDAKGNALPMSPIPRLRFFRYQAGKAAIVLDPVAGDQGVAVFFKQDSSGVQDGAKEAVVPGSFRNFDQSDGVVFSGVQNQAPTVWIELTQDEKVVIHAPQGVTIETDETAEITAGEKVSITAPAIELNGAITSHGQNGGAGTMDINGTLTVDGINMNAHTHTGAHGETSGPH